MLKLGLALSVSWVLLSGQLLSAATLEELAKAEGKVTFYSSLNNEYIQPLVDAFAKKYPDIKPSFYRANSDRVVQKILTESQAGHHAVDVFSAADSKIHLLKEKGLTLRFVSNENLAYSDGFKDPEGHWTSVLLVLSSMGYNTDSVSPLQAPKTYDDLLDPKWKGKIGINPREGEWYLSLQYRMGKEKAKDFLKRLSGQNLNFREGNTLLAQLLGAGEFDIIPYVNAHTLARFKEKGTPVQWVFDEPIITHLHTIALARNALHPNAGKLFINFVLSIEGQKILGDHGIIPSRRDTDNKFFDLKKKNLFPSDPRWGNEYESALMEMGTILGVR